MLQILLVHKENGKIPGGQETDMVEVCPKKQEVDQEIGEKLEVKLWKRVNFLLIL